MVSTSFCIAVLYSIVASTGRANVLPSLDQLVLMGNQDAVATGCWRDAYSRGLGKLASVCANGTESEAGLCFKQCQSGYRGVGPLCIRTSVDAPDQYYRGTGELAQCDSNSGYEDQNGPWCFKECSDGYEGVGPVCLALNCPASLPFPCGPSVCSKSFSQCTSTVVSVTTKGYHALYRLARMDPAGFGKEMRELIMKMLSWPLCRAVNGGEEFEFEEKQRILADVYEQYSQASMQ